MMEKRVSSELVSTEPRSVIAPRINYGQIFLRAVLIVVGITALIVGPPLLSGKLRLSAIQAPALTPPHLPTLSLLVEAGPVIQAHLATVLLAMGIGVYLMANRKGTPVHRQLGWIYAGAMFITGVVTLFIPRLPVGPHLGPFGPLHLFSAFTLYGVPAALLAARRGNWSLHGRIMAGLFIGGVGIAGVAAFMPGRLMHQIFFG
jgi:uncharacterized membrane protein